MEGLEHMGYFDTETVVLPLPSDPRNAGAEPASDGSRPPGYWVEVKHELSFADVNFRNGRLVRIESKGLSGAQNADAKWAINEFGQATLERAILAWNLTERQRTREVELPLTPANIGRLRQSDAAFILATVLNTTSEDEQDETGKDSASTTKPSADEPE